MGLSINGGTHNLSILMGFSLINQPFWVPSLWKPPYSLMITPPYHRWLKHQRSVEISKIPLVYLPSRSTPLSFGVSRYGDIERYPKICRYMELSEKLGGNPQIIYKSCISIHFNRAVHDKPSVVGVAVPLMAPHSQLRPQLRARLADSFQRGQQHRSGAHGLWRVFFVFFFARKI